MSEPHITDYLSAWRAASIGDREIIEGIVAPEHAGPSEPLARALATWESAEAGGAHYFDAQGEARWLVLLRERAQPRERWWRHLLLLALTLVTTTVAGASFAGGHLAWNALSGSALRAGLAFSIPLAAIMLAHESGHYLAARRLRVDASPPFFIPFPPEWNLIGTMGAFIRLRSPIFDRRTLFDIGVAGPFAGMIVALPILLAGLALSHPTPIAAPSLAHQFLLVDGDPLFLGDSLLLVAARALFGLSGALQLHPLAIAGWVGGLVTSLNLLPLAQFDGGHIAYAMDTRAQRVVAVYIWIALVGLGTLWVGWWLWAAVALVVGRGKLAHPPVMAPERALDARRMMFGWIALALFVLTFVPVPVRG